MSSGPSGRPWRIVLVDDNEDLIDSLRTVLARGVGRPLTISAFSSRDKALAEVEQHGFDVAIVDVKLLDGSGVELASQLRERCPLGEVILITGFATVDSAIAALKSGAYAFVLKSFRPEELVATVDQALTKVELLLGKEELEGRYRDLVELTDVFVLGFDRSFRVALMNRSACEVAGVSQKEALGKSLVECWIPEPEREKFSASVARIERVGGPQECETDFVAQGEAGSEPPARRRVRWHLSAAHDLVYAIGIDVTDRLALERRLREGEALSAMSVLAMHLAHEIRNPLNAAVLQLHVMTRQIDKLAVEQAHKTRLRGRAQVVEEEIKRLNRMLTEFLELARPRGVVREPVDLGALAAEVLELEQESAAQRGVRFERELPEQGPVVLGDREKLKQVILNLVINAVEAMKEGGGSLRVSVATDANGISLTVQDDGPGMDPETIERAFEPFFTTKEGGTGLGLSIVKKLVDQHEGTLEVVSERRQGTRIEVRLRPPG